MPTKAQLAKTLKGLDEMVIDHQNEIITQLEEELYKEQIKNKKLLRNLKQLDECILLAHRGKVKQRYEEMEKPWIEEMRELPVE